MAGAVAASRSEAACPIAAGLAQGGNRPSARRPPRSAYLHIPFCHRRCFYCDFPVVPLGDRAGGGAGQSGSRSIEAYLELITAEIAASPPGPPLSTVYVGGGTPSMLTAEQLQVLLRSLRNRYGLAPGAEISLELDPASFDQTRLQGYLQAGVNRVSLGGQSFDDQVLERLGRRHRRADLVEAAAWLQAARAQGELVSWSLDLIQGLPGATAQHWQQQLQQALALDPPHLSVYDLIVEPGTVFERLESNGQLQLPLEDLAADLMELTAGTLAAAGFGHYEISNYAQPGHASRHNRVYWSGAGWWGFGMGATAAPWGERQPRPRTREGYAAWLQRDPVEGPEPQPMPIDERVMVGLRRREGVMLSPLLAGLDQAELKRRWQPYLERGLLRREGGRWRLSDPEGLALSNAVLREWLAWWEEQVAEHPPSP
ncbi:radical SAM family heme chaperone HemW [Synechococcus sp. A10-1-5-1]|uniref:radical SAM family heme chaperone HemW n=1 Tax=Synechococcus sp. A10-1-5-1 TaxID=2936507 RepID=UPI0020006FB0|nr:radical SAM family heme chaperone HemW [Synechococcus sp. A10-1-5-1]UPM51141.1 radical SAM family heme chaperone HemW [Synechococcus sp. A10-1-5-1]